MNNSCQSRLILHSSRMKQALFWIPAFCAMALSLSNCANNQPADTSTGGTLGPFDEHGRYVEAWADDPSKWRRSGGTQHETKPQIAKNDEVPLNSVPLAPSGSKPGRASTSKPITLTPLPPARTSPTKSQPTEVARVTPKRTVKESVEEESPKPKAKTTPVKVKPKVKPKPKAVRYTVKKGDTLSGIASKTGASVSAIKSENGISGSMIHPGQTLTIPKR